MVDYNNFAQTFSQSRKNMKWEEISYFLADFDLATKNILDVWCGNGRFYGALLTSPLVPLLAREGNIEYLWIDLSQWLLDEAKKTYPWVRFESGNMLQLKSFYSSSSCKERGLGGEVGAIFFIASFHHLDTLEKRVDVMRQAYDLMSLWGKIYMTNWSLNSEMNQAKYKSSEVTWSENKYWSSDYQIKIWEHRRYYHCFALSELEYIFLEAGFEILENREFENKRNIISILKKTS